jgi:hypothetical protein
MFLLYYTKDLSDYSQHSHHYLQVVEKLIIPIKRKSLGRSRFKQKLKFCDSFEINLTLICNQLAQNISDQPNIGTK